MAKPKAETEQTNDQAPAESPTAEAQPVQYSKASSVDAMLEQMEKAVRDSAKHSPPAVQNALLMVASSIQEARRRTA